MSADADWWGLTSTAAAEAAAAAAAAEANAEESDVSSEGCGGGGGGEEEVVRLAPSVFGCGGRRGMNSIHWLLLRRSGVPSILPEDRSG